MTSASITGSTIGKVINPKIVSSIKKTAPTIIKGSITTGKKTSETIIAESPNKSFKASLIAKKKILINSRANKRAVKIIIIAILFIL